MTTDTILLILVLAYNAIASGLTLIWLLQEPKRMRKAVDEAFKVMQQERVQAVRQMEDSRY